jgi:hypothetical protein
VSRVVITKINTNKIIKDIHSWHLKEQVLLLRDLKLVSGINHRLTFCFVRLLTMIIVVDRSGKDKDISVVKELLKGLNEREVEIDHLQTTVVSLS